MDSSSSARNVFSQNYHNDLDFENSIIGEEIVVVTPGEGNTARPTPGITRAINPRFVNKFVSGP